MYVRAHINSPEQQPTEWWADMSNMSVGGMYNVYQTTYARLWDKKTCTSIYNLVVDMDRILGLQLEGKRYARLHT